MARSRKQAATALARSQSVRVIQRGVTGDKLQFVLALYAALKRYGTEAQGEIHIDANRLTATFAGFKKSRAGTCLEAHYGDMAIYSTQGASPTSQPYQKFQIARFLRHFIEYLQDKAGVTAEAVHHQSKVFEMKPPAKAAEEDPSCQHIKAPTQLADDEYLQSAKEDNTILFEVVQQSGRNTGAASNELILMVRRDETTLYNPTKKTNIVISPTGEFDYQGKRWRVLNIGIRVNATQEQLTRFINTTSTTPSPCQKAQDDSSDEANQSFVSSGKNDADDERSEHSETSSMPANTRGVIALTPGPAHVRKTNGHCYWGTAFALISLGGNLAIINLVDLPSVLRHIQLAELITVVAPPLLVSSTKLMYDHWRLHQGMRLSPTDPHNKNCCGSTFGVKFFPPHQGEAAPLLPTSNSETTQSSPQKRGCRVTCAAKSVLDTFATVLSLGLVAGAHYGAQFMTDPNGVTTRNLWWLGKAVVCGAQYWTHHGTARAYDKHLRAAQAHTPANAV